MKAQLNRPPYEMTESPRPRPEGVNGRQRRRLRPALLALEDRTLLATFMVTKTLDDGTIGTLRWAIGQVNTTAGPNTINFDPAHFATPQTITLTLGELSLMQAGPANATTITGPAAGVTVSGGDVSRVFQVDPGVTASISGMTITGGSTSGFGGGLLNYGTATLTNCTVSDNSASSGGGLSNYGSASLVNCTVSDNKAVTGVNNKGGGLANDGTLTLTSSTISGNVAKGGSFVQGGGVYNSGDVTLTGVTVSGNSATGGSSSDLGGGLNNNDGVMILVNSTVSGNSTVGGSSNAGGGIYNTFQLTLTNVTVIANSAVKGGGLSNFSSATLTNTIVAGNVGAPSEIAGTVVPTSSFNLIGTSGSGGLTNGANNNQVGAANPLLGTLGNYGGPTQTIPLLPGSPAIGKGTTADYPGTSTPITTDQRGFPLDSPTPDIGSFQTQTGLVVNTTSDGTGSASGELSLRQAVNLANVLGVAGTITFDPTVFASAQTITLTGTQLELSNTSGTETITGPAAGVTVSGGGLSRVFQVDEGVTASISGLTITGG